MSELEGFKNKLKVIEADWTTQKQEIYKDRAAQPAVANHQNGFFSPASSSIAQSPSPPAASIEIDIQSCSIS